MASPNARGMPFRDDEETGNANAVRQGYVNATRVSPLTRRAHEQILGGYGLRIGWAKGQSDAAISRAAARAVLDKFKADQAAARARNETPPASNQPNLGGASPSFQGRPDAPGTPGTPGGAPMVGGAGASASGSRSSGGSYSRAMSSGGQMLPDTSVMRSGTLSGTSGLAPITIPIPLQHLQVRSILNQYGLPYENPPPSATMSTADLLMWINARKAEIQTIRNAQVQARPPQPYEPPSTTPPAPLAKQIVAPRALASAPVAARQLQPAPQIRVGAKAAPAPARTLTSAVRAPVRIAAKSPVTKPAPRPTQKRPVIR